MSNYCPHCHEEIDKLNWEGSYSEIIYGSCFGTYDIETEDHDTDEQNSNDSDNYEEDIDSYSCPKCSHQVYIDDIIDEDDLEEDEDGNLVFPDGEPYKVATPYVGPKRPSIAVNLLMKKII